ncbi:hypothetical protein [Cyanobium sp. ATX 6E8]|uniref:hypothetical protein n=1 Tax=Cyanobium sp. ATX 6E8 TaxID=2823701 RepID=UPI0020CCC9E7|nr:hypothetical protein [Cyanobium sp. ATX 6E8]
MVRRNHPRMGADSLLRRDDDGRQNDTHTKGGGMTCLGRTCLKWQADGELTALDRQLVLQRLVLVDQDATDLLSLLADDLPCPSLS